MTSVVALPRKLVAPPKINGDDRVRCQNVELYPANATGQTEFTPEGASRIVFNVPAYSGSFINPKRSYMSFTITKTGGTATASRLVDGLPWIERMTTRIGTQTVEDIQDYNVLERAENWMKTQDAAQTRASLEGDYADLIHAYASAEAAAALAAVVLSQNTGKCYTKPLLSGIFGKDQEYYIPVGLLEASGYAAQLEFYLAKATSVVKLNNGSSDTPSYKLSNVKLHLEVVTLPERAMAAFNSEVMSGGMVSLPFTTSRVHKQYIPDTQQSIDMNISEAAQDIQSVTVCLRKQSAIGAYNVAAASNGHLQEVDGLMFVGGTGVTGVTAVERWQFRYGQKYYPPAAVENLGGSLPTILAGMASTDMLYKAPKVLATRRLGAPEYEKTGFQIRQGFKSSEDDILNGLNAASSGAPIQLFLKFKTASTGNTPGANLALDAFVAASYTLNVFKNGQVSLVDGQPA